MDNENNFSWPKKNVKDTAGIFSLMFYGYVIDIVKVFKNPKTLDQSEIWPPEKSHDVIVKLKVLEREWHKQLQKPKPSLLKALGYTLKRNIITMVLVYIVGEVIFRVSAPRVLLWFLTTLDNSDVTTDHFWYTHINNCWFTGVLSALMIGVLFFCGNTYFFMMHRTGILINALLSGLVYKKVLKMTRTSFEVHSAGKIVNLASKDLDQFTVQTVWTIHALCAPLIQIAVFVYLCFELGVLVTILCFGFLLVVSCGQWYLIAKINGLRKKYSTKTDNRINFIKEMLHGIQTIKMYGWEHSFTRLMEKIRKQEIKEIQRQNTYWTLLPSATYWNNRMLTAIALFLMSYYGINATTEESYMIMLYFTSVAQTFNGAFVMGLNCSSILKVVVDRVQALLLSEEMVLEEDKPRDSSELCEIYRTIDENFEKCESRAVVMTPQSTRIVDTKEQRDVITFESVSCKYTKLDNHNILENISLTIQTGQLVGVIGPVGSGKSSLLQTFLGELVITQGQLQVPSKISYASQDNWVFGETVRQNILFGKPFNPVRYEKVLEVCGLRKDLQILENGDLTIIGERGVTLSGGQKSRVNLARAVYRDVDVYLLDDPLSAVDTHVGAAIFQECICKFLQGKTVVLVTHQVQYLSDVDWVVVMNEGQIKTQGKFSAISSMVNTFKGEAKDSQVQEKIIPSENPPSKDVHLQGNIADYHRSKLEHSEQSSKFTNKNLIWSYSTCGNHPAKVLCIFGLFLLTQLISIAFDLWLERANQVSPERSWIHSKITGVIITVILVVVAAIRCYVFISATSGISERLHSMMFGRIVKCPVDFFVGNPTGRILNRFSSDIGTVDEQIPQLFLEGIQGFLLCFSGLLLTAFIFPPIIVAYLLIAAIFIPSKNLYTQVGANLSRLVGMTKSHTFSYLSATLEGIVTIRVNKMEDILTEQYLQHVSRNLGASYMFLFVNSAYGLFIIACSFFTFVFLILSTCLCNEFYWKTGHKHGLSVTKEDMGLAVVEIYIIAFVATYFIKRILLVVMLMTSYERALEYTELPIEDYKDQLTEEIPETWPEHGAIAYKNVYCSYPTREVLKDLTFVINPGEKIGVVGRTGAGKSSLIASLFRFMSVSGDITIDGVDTGRVPLKRLRKSLTVIPQDPVLFSGTLRWNLDPFDEHTDDNIWSALQLSALKATFPNLETVIQKSGENFSVGQRQLICLARAILRKSRVLILDEATANVDFETDKLIQRTIRESFSQCTIITIAHRLDSIMDSDRVMVLDDGEIREYDHPFALGQQRGLFFKMVEKTGMKTSRKLMAIAEERFRRRTDRHLDDVE